MIRLLGFFLSTLLFFTVATSTFASGTSSCEPVYGGGEVCKNNVQFTINKLVATPTKGGSYVENLTANDNRYQAGSTINFKIVIKNTGNSPILNLNVEDEFPQYLTFLSGVGNTNKGATSINFVIGRIEAGKSVEYVISTKAADSSALPTTVNCVVNKVSADSPDGAQASDQAQVCIEKLAEKPQAQVMEKPTVNTIPATGPETDILLGLLGTGSLGFFIRKKIS